MSPVFEVIASMEFSIGFCLKSFAGKPAEGQQAWAILDLHHEKGSNCLARDPCLFFWYIVCVSSNFSKPLLLSHYSSVCGSWVFTE